MKNSQIALQTNQVPMSNLYRFGQFVLDPRRRALSRADLPVLSDSQSFRRLGPSSSKPKPSGH